MNLEELKHNEKILFLKPFKTIYLTGHNLSEMIHSAFQLLCGLTNILRVDGSLPNIHSTSFLLFEDALLLKLSVYCIHPPVRLFFVRLHDS